MQKRDQFAAIAKALRHNAGGTTAEEQAVDDEINEAGVFAALDIIEATYNQIDSIATSLYEIAASKKRADGL